MHALSPESGAKYGSINFRKITRTDVQHTATILWTAYGESFDLPGGWHFEASNEEEIFQRSWTTLLGKLLASGALKTHPVRLGQGGLSGVLDGLELLRQGKVSGEKLVYRVTDAA